MRHARPFFAGKACSKLEEGDGRHGRLLRSAPANSAQAASRLQQVKDEDADKWDAPSPATDPPSPATERDAALHALEEALPTEEMGEVEGVKVEPDAQLAENTLEEFWANAPDGSGQHPMEEMEEWCAYHDAAEFADGEDAELGFGAEEEEVPVEV